MSEKFATVEDYIAAFAPEPLESEIAPFRSGRDSVNFRYTKPIPYGLVSRIAAFLAQKHAATA